MTTFDRPSLMSPHPLSRCGHAAWSGADRRCLLGADAGVPDGAEPHEHPAAILDQRLYRAGDDAGIISGGIDLSVGRSRPCRRFLGAAMMVAGVPVAAGGAGGPGDRGGLWAIQRALIAWGGLQPFIVTLGGLSLFRAFALIYTGAHRSSASPGVSRVHQRHAGRVPNPVLIVVVLASVAWVILNRTPLGEYMMAVGGNEEAARISGVPVKLTKLAAYMISGLMAAVAANDPDRAAWRGGTDAGNPLGTGRHRRGGHRGRVAHGRGAGRSWDTDRLHHPGRPAQRPNAHERPGLLPVAGDRYHHHCCNADRPCDSGKQG